MDLESHDSISTCEDQEHTYIIPTKCVKTQLDMPKWEKSEAYYDLIGFIHAISVAVQGKPISFESERSPIIDSLLKLFRKLNKIIDDTPAVSQPQRFGNIAYRAWYYQMKDSAIEYIQKIVPENLHRAVPELCAYYTESFGNSTRIDYGTGHELSFVMFLCCLFKLELLTENDRAAAGLKVFNAYLEFVRKLQINYRMEPAGSHGVWSLDDYQFIPFIWGSAQLAVHAPLEPSQFVENEKIDEFKNEYMFISCIDYIRQVKTGHFAEHSNQLWSISAVQSWSKINTGLVKMYQKEILSKFPVVQHVLFGSLLSINPVKLGTTMPNSRLGMLPPQSNKRVEIGDTVKE